MFDKTFIRVGANQIVMFGFLTNPTIGCVIDCDALMAGERTFPCCINTCLTMCKLMYQLNATEVATAKCIAMGFVRPKKEK